MDSGFLIVCLAGFLFGTLGIAGRFIGNTYGLGPLAIGAWRIFIATPALLILAYANGALSLVLKGARLEWGVRWRIAGFGAGIVAYQVGFFNAIQRTRVSTATMIALCTVPVFVAVLSTVTGMERLTRRTLYALALSIVGIVLLSSGDARAILDPSCVVGNLFALLAGISCAGFTLFGKTLMRTLPPIGVTASAFSVATLLALPLANAPRGLPAQGWLAILYMGIVSTALGYALFNYGLSKTSPTAVSIAIFVEPLTATMLSVVLLRERLTPGNTVGIALLLTSLVIMSLPERSRDQASPPRPGQTARIPGEQAGS